MAQPLVEAGLGELGVGGGDEGCVRPVRREVAGVGVRNHVAGIVAVARALADEVVEAELLGSRDLDDAVGWRPESNLGHRAGDVVGGHGLDEHWRQAHSGAVSEVATLGQALGGSPVPVLLTCAGGRRGFGGQVPTDLVFHPIKGNAADEDVGERHPEQLRELTGIVSVKARALKPGLDRPARVARFW
jgi:hypothetical protein